MIEFEKKNYSLNTPLSKLLPNIDLGDKHQLTVKEMFSHQSGLFPWIPFYKKTIDSITNKPLSFWYKSNKSKGFNIKVNENLYLKDVFLDSISSEILKSELFKEKSYVYSDLPYYFMKEFLEKKNFSDLDFQLKKKFYLQ